MKFITITKTADLLAAFDKASKMTAVLDNLRHQCACSALVMLAHNTLEPINKLYGTIKKRHQGEFRFWAGKMSEYKDGDKVRHWLAWSEKEGFTVTKKSEEQRKAFREAFAEGGDLPSYFEDKDKEAKPVTLAMILKALAQLEERIDKRADKMEEGEVPATVLAKLHALSTEANKHLVH